MDTLTKTIAELTTIIAALCAAGWWLWRRASLSGRMSAQASSFEKVVSEKFDQLTDALDRLAKQYEADRLTLAAARGNYEQWRDQVDTRLDGHDKDIRRLTDRGVTGGVLPLAREGQPR